MTIRDSYVKAHLNGEKCDVGCTICEKAIAQRIFERDRALTKKSRGPEPSPSDATKRNAKRRVLLVDANDCRETLTKEQYEQRYG